MAKYQNAFLERIDEDEKELVEQESKLKNEEQEETEDEVSPAEQTWRKRHGDLRRHSQKKEEELNKELEKVREQLSEATRAQIKYPKTEEEVQTWMDKYPDVAKIVQTIAMQESHKTQKELNELRELSKKEREEIRKEKAYADLLRVHPDFEDIKNSSDFHDWISDLGEDHWVVKALFENDTDAKTAAQALSYYKDVKGVEKKNKSSENNRDDSNKAARDIPRSHANAPTKDEQNKWSESRVEALSAIEYEKYEEDIMKAVHSGKFNYDITGGAR